MASLGVVRGCFLFPPVLILFLLLIQNNCVLFADTYLLLLPTNMLPTFRGFTVTLRFSYCETRWGLARETDDNRDLAGSSRIALVVRPYLIQSISRESQGQEITFPYVRGSLIPRKSVGTEIYV